MRQSRKRFRLLKFIPKHSKTVLTCSNGSSNIMLDLKKKTVVVLRVDLQGQQYFLSIQFLLLFHLCCRRHGIKITHEATTYVYLHNFSINTDNTACNTGYISIRCHLSGNYLNVHIYNLIIVNRNLIIYLQSQQPYQ